MSFIDLESSREFCIGKTITPQILYGRGYQKVKDNKLVNLRYPEIGKKKYLPLSDRPSTEFLEYVAYNIPDEGEVWFKAIKCPLIGGCCCGGYLITGLLFIGTKELENGEYEITSLNIGQFEWEMPMFYSPGMGPDGKFTFTQQGKNHTDVDEYIFSELENLFKGRCISDKFNFRGMPLPSSSNCLSGFFSPYRIVNIEFDIEEDDNMKFKCGTLRTTYPDFCMSCAGERAVPDPADALECALEYVDHLSDEDWKIVEATL